MLEGYNRKPNPLSAVIDHWWEGNVVGGLDVSWRSVVTALRNMDEHGLAGTIEAKHC